MPRHVLAVVGPTAVGKSDLAESLARELDGEIISADAMQVYRGMDIGTAKRIDTPQDIVIHGIDLTSIDDTYSAALFQRYARSVIEEIHSRSKRAILCGGTGLYIDAALNQLEFLPGGQENPELREELELLAETEGPEAVYGILVSRDSRSAKLIHPRNTRRVIRALEMYERGESYAERAHTRHEVPAHYPHTLIGLTMDRVLLYERIDARVMKMIESGLLDEITELLDAGFEDALTALQAIGYKEFLPVIRGEKELDLAVKEVQQASRRYAKRQLTWFRRSVEHWIDVTDLTHEETLERAMDIVGGS